MSLRHRLSDATDRLPIGHSFHLVTPLRLSLVALISVAVLALAVLFWPGSDGLLVPSEAGEPTITVPPSPTASPPAEPSPSAEPTAIATPTPAPSARAEWDVLTWSDPVTPPFVVHLAGLVPWNDGYVAVGSIEVDPERSDAGFLTSPDGTHWNVEHQAQPGSDRLPAHLVRVDGELLAFSKLPVSGSVPLIWVSPDGATWSVVEDSTWADAWSGLDLGPMPATWDVTQHAPVTGLVDAASGPEGIVVIGNAFDGDRMAPVLLHSSTGRAWSAAGLPADSPNAMLNAVIARGDGFVAVGAIGIGPDLATAEPAAWLSDDGVTWARAAVETDAFGQQALGGEFGPLLSGEGGMVTCRGNRGMSAGGYRFGTPYLSSDGHRWQVDLNRNASPACGWAADDGERIVVLGPSMAPIPWPGLSLAWLSTDGATWQPVELTSTLPDMLERFWVVPDGVIYAGVQSFWFGTPTGGP